MALGMFDQIVNAPRPETSPKVKWLIFLADAWRAMLGTWALYEGAMHWPFLVQIHPYLPIGVIVVVLLVTTGVQMITHRDKEYVLAPIGYVAGTLYILATPVVALLSLALGFATLTAARHWGAFFVGAGLSCAGLGAFLAEGNRLFSVGAGLVLFMPGIISLLSRRSLAVGGR